MNSSCITKLALGAAATALLLSPGLLFEIPKMNHLDKPDGIGFHTLKTNIMAIVVHALLAFLVYKYLVAPFILKRTASCPAVLPAKGTAEELVNANYATKLRQYLMNNTAGAGSGSPAFSSSCGGSPKRTAHGKSSCGGGGSGASSYAGLTNNSYASKLRSYIAGPSNSSNSSAPNSINERYASKLREFISPKRSFVVDEDNMTSNSSTSINKEYAQKLREYISPKGSQSSLTTSSAPSGINEQYASKLREFISPKRSYVVDDIPSSSLSSSCSMSSCSVPSGINEQYASKLREFISPKRSYIVDDDMPASSGINEEYAQKLREFISPKRSYVVDTLPNTSSDYASPKQSYVVDDFPQSSNTFTSPRQSFVVG